MNNSTVTKIYDRYSFFYDYIFKNIFDSARKRVFEKANFIGDERIIEFGVGTGLSFKYYPTAIPLDITGIDLSQKMLKIAKKKVKRYKNLNINLQCLNAENTPYQTSSFDKVILLYVYSVTANPFALLKEAMRICKENGSIYIVNHFSNFGKKKLNLAERILNPWSNVIGFRSDFSYIKYVKDLNINVEDVESSNVFSITKIVHLKKHKNMNLISL